MEIKNAELFKVMSFDLEPLNLNAPQIAFVGRSNVGKSSLINYLTGVKNLAKTSKDPGKTKTLNYYNCNKGHFYLVDLPGYGYAKVSKELKNSWAKGVDKFFSEESKCLALLLLDSRRQVSENDILMVEYFYGKRIPYTVLVVKSDLIVNKSSDAIKLIMANQIKIGCEDIILVSSKNAVGREEVLKRIENQIKALS